MDLGIRGRTAIVCAGSRGLGKGCAAALAAEGVRLVLNARDPGPLAATAAALRRDAGVEVIEVAADVGTEAGRAALLAACPDPDILVNNSGGPPPGDFREWGEAEWHAALQNNMVSPILLIRAVIDGMIGRRFGRVVNITSAAVKAPYPALGLSNGARTGLTGFVAGLSRQVVRHGVTINNLLPGSHDTDRLRAVAARGAAARRISPEQAYEEARQAEVAGRFGTIEEFGAACAFLCSDKAGFITGQNLLLDGGYYHGTL